MDNKGANLTICIPTYNRRDKLLSCLEHLCPYITDEIMVVIRDNASNSYNCLEAIQPYIDKYGIAYQRNNVNVGMEANIAKCFEFCDTKWLWILGDDDWVSPSAVKKVLNTISLNPNAIFLKFNAARDVKAVGFHEFCDVMKPDYTFSNSYFISEGIHNVWLTKDEMIWHYKYLSTNIGQILRVVKHIMNNDNSECVFIKEPLLEDHGENISWSHFELVQSFLYVFDIFRNKKSDLKDNIFKCIASLSLIYIKDSNISLKEKIYYSNLIIYKYGILNSIHYLFKRLLSFYFRIFICNK
ncbi:Glycosyltransferase involved in cell wall bisynthesis [Prevotellaceae bacterium HUN156]|nr:Glycosyltransferase involved in cell wall bisynthesis [Prevotellaceae bacterium HUN156]